MTPRSDVIEKLGADIARALHGLEGAHKATADESTSAVFCAAIGFVYARTKDEEHFRAMIMRCADLMVRSLDDPNVVKIRLPREVVQ